MEQSSNGTEFFPLTNLTIHIPMKSITSIRILPGQSTLSLDVHGRSLPFSPNLLALFAAQAEKAGFDAKDALCELSPVDRWRIIKRDEKWEVEAA